MRTSLQHDYNLFTLWCVNFDSSAALHHPTSQLMKSPKVAPVRGPICRECRLDQYRTLGAMYAEILIGINTFGHLFNKLWAAGLFLEVSYQFGCVSNLFRTQESQVRGLRKDSSNLGTEPARRKKLVPSDNLRESREQLGTRASLILLRRPRVPQLKGAAAFYADLSGSIHYELRLEISHSLLAVRTGRKTERSTT